MVLSFSVVGNRTVVAIGKSNNTIDSSFDGDYLQEEVTKIDEDNDDGQNDSSCSIKDTTTVTKFSLIRIINSNPSSTTNDNTTKRDDDNDDNSDDKTSAMSTTTTTKIRLINSWINQGVSLLEKQWPRGIDNNSSNDNDNNTTTNTTTNIIESYKDKIVYQQPQNRSQLRTSSSDDDDEIDNNNNYYMLPCSYLLIMENNNSNNIQDDDEQQGDGSFSKKSLTTQTVDGVKVVGHGRLTECFESAGGNAVAATFVVVSKQYRSKGIGSILMELLENEAIRLNYHYVYLWTRTTIVKFYEKIGYTKCQRVSLIRPCLKSLQVNQVDTLEAMLFKKQQQSSDNTKAFNNTLKRKETIMLPPDEATNGNKEGACQQDDDIWLRVEYSLYLDLVIS